jgi:hypothetical protein
MTRALSNTLPTQLPARYRRGVMWKLDKRIRLTREITADLYELSVDLGGWDQLSVQQRILCERVVFIRRRVLEFESALLSRKPAPFEAGVYSNLANVLVGYLKALGLERRARDVQDLAAHFAKHEAATVEPAP